MKASYINHFDRWMREFSFFTEVRVRFSETDMYGHLNNTVPFVYFELARIEYLKHLKLEGWQDAQSDKIPVVADLQCDFLQQVFFDEQLKIYVKAAKVGSSSVDIHYLGINEANKPVFVGRGTIVQINKQTGKAERWSEAELQILNGQPV